MADEKKPGNEACPPVKGVSVPFTTRVANIPERAPDSESPARKKMPPSPGPLPSGKDVDPDKILNR